MEKQTYMFDMEAPNADSSSILLQSPAPEKMKEVSDRLSLLTKSELVDMCSVFHPMMKTHTSIKRRLTDGTVVGATILEALTKSSYRKSDICDALAFMLANPENLRVYTDTLSEEMRQLWRQVLVRIYLPLDEVRNILNTHDKLSSRESQSSHYFYNTHGVWNRKELNWFTIVSRKGKEISSWGYQEDTYYLAISPMIHRIFFPVFHPDALADHSVATLPEGEFRVVGSEAEALRGYPVISAMLANDDLALSSGRYPVSGMKGAQKRLNMPDFGIGETPELRSALYVELLALSYLSNANRHSSPASSYPKAVRDVMQRLSSYYYYLPQFIFAHIKGLTRNVTNENLCTDLTAHDLKLLAAHAEHWVPIQDFYMQSLMHVGTTHDVPYPTLVFATNRDDYRTHITNTLTGQLVTVEDYTRHFGTTFHKGLLYALAALGLVKLACRPKAENPISPYAAVAYARLTALGRYTLGVTQKYEAAQANDKPLFQLDDQHLIVRDLASEGNNPSLPILQELSHSIGGGRYEVTPQTFLTCCASRTDVERRVKNFRDFICAKPPAVWRDFFAMIESRCHPLTLSHTDFRVYTLPADDRDLQRLMVTDPQLRQLVIRAEGLRILVRTNDLTKFSNRLKALGYLL